MVYLFVNQLQIVHFNRIFNKICKIITQNYNFMFIIRQLRRKKNLNQTDLGRAIGVSLRTIQLYEKEDASIPRKNLTKIAQYFDVRVDQLYARGVNELDLVYDKENKLSKKCHQINKLGPGKYLLSSPLVTVKNQMEYIEKRDSNLFLSSLVRMGFIVDQVSVSTYIAFEVANNSMNNGLAEGIPEKAVVLGKQVHTRELNRKIDGGTTLWILVYKDSIMCKKITDYNKKKGTIICHSLNDSPEYPDFEIHIDDVKQFFVIIKKQVD